MSKLEIVEVTWKTGGSLLNYGKPTEICRMPISFYSVYNFLKISGERDILEQGTFGSCNFLWYKTKWVIRLCLCGHNFQVRHQQECGCQTLLWLAVFPVPVGA